MKWESITDKNYEGMLRSGFGVERDLISVMDMNLENAEMGE